MAGELEAGKIAPVSKAHGFDTMLRARYPSFL